MNVGISIDTSAVEKRFKNVNIDLAIFKALSKTSQKGINVILDRTAKGKGIYAPFKRYSQKYAAFRAEKGRSINPDLNFSGKMLGSIKSAVKTSDKLANIYFSRKSEAKKALGNNKTRPFFGFNEKEKLKLVKLFAKNFKL